MLQQALNFQEGHNQNHVCTSMIGDANWLFNDYSSGAKPHYCTSGIVDFFRLPKFIYHFYTSQRDPQGEFMAKPMLFIASYWTEQSTLSVRVFSNCEEVELRLNGAVIARQKPDRDIFSTNLAHPPFTFSVPAFIPGELKASGIIAGKLAAAQSVRTPGKPAKIRLVTRLAGVPVSKNAKDAFFVHAEILDRSDTLVPDASLLVTFAATGAEMASPETVTAEAGIASALLITPSDGHPVRVSATATGLEAASLTVK
jgi:beta-galactosidase